VIEFSEKWLSKKIMCGIACGYGCCNSPTFKVTSEEHERTFLQEKYETSPKEIEPQNGHCRFLKQMTQVVCLGKIAQVVVKYFH